jgi:hypothetical protein
MSKEPPPPKKSQYKLEDLFQFIQLCADHSKKQVPSSHTKKQDDGYRGPINWSPIFWGPRIRSF